MGEKSPEAESPAWAMDAEQFRRLGHEAVEMAAAHLQGLAAGPVFRPMSPREREALLSHPFPERGVPAAQILHLIQERILSHPMGNGHPRFFGWVNSPPAPLAVIADLLASTLDPSCAGGDHAAIYLERCVVRWLMELLDFPVEGSFGLLVSGGSMASLTCLAAARHRAARLAGWDLRQEGLAGHPQLVMYVSEEGHSCLRKAAELLGLGAQGVHVIDVDPDRRIDLAGLEAAVRADRARGWLPFCVAASAGTVNTGAIDPLRELADFCEAGNLWLHVDGAYGALGILDPDRRERYRGMERCDSLALDPHKWLSVPLECGCALLRDGALLRDAFSLVPSYLRTEEGRGFGGLPWFSEFGFQQTRGFRALKLAAVLLVAGREGITRQIRRHNALAGHLAARIRREEQLELLAEPVLSIVNFRFAPEAMRERPEAVDDLNKKIVESLQNEGKVFLTGTQLHHRFSLRACVLHYATRETDLDLLVDCVLAAGRDLSG